MREATLSQSHQPSENTITKIQPVARSITDNEFKSMGWWWSSSQAPEDQPTQPAPHNEPPAFDPPTPAPDTTAPPRQLTRDEQADAELTVLLAQLTAETTTTTHTNPPTSLTNDSDHPPPSPTHTPTPPTTSSISPSTLHPTSMSCRQAFDSAFYCQSLGGQFNNIYRYGGMRDCRASWGQFWFCMRTKSQPEGEERRRMVQEHYRQRAGKYKVGPSSEDVWEVREEAVVGAFAGDLEALEREEREVEREGERGERERGEVE